MDLAFGVGVDGKQDQRSREDVSVVHEESAPCSADVDPVVIRIFLVPHFHCKYM